MEGGTWPWIMCPHTLKKSQNHSQNHLGQNNLVKVHTPYMKGQPPKERCGEWTKAKINASWSKITSISKWTSSTKGSKSTSTNGWKIWKILMVSLHGATCVLGASAHITQAYSPTWARAPMHGVSFESVVGLFHGTLTQSQENFQDSYAH
jgi:hypothetical protein